MSIVGDFLERESLKKILVEEIKQKNLTETQIRQYAKELNLTEEELMELWPFGPAKGSEAWQQQQLAKQQKYKGKEDIALAKQYAKQSKIKGALEAEGKEEKYLRQQIEEANRTLADPNADESAKKTAQAFINVNKPKYEKLKLTRETKLSTKTGKIEQKYGAKAGALGTKADQIKWNNVIQSLNYAAKQATKTMANQKFSSKNFGALVQTLNKSLIPLGVKLTSSEIQG